MPARNQQRLDVFNDARWGMVRMTPAETYRSHAAECIELAQKAQNPEDRARLLLMAQAWRQLAERLEAKDETTD
jgi:hypothetical protein